MLPRISTKIPELTLRFATELDVPLVLDFIKKLAEYEKRLAEVVADETILHASLFGQRQVAEVMIADYNDEPVGFALFFHNFSTFLGRPGIYVEDIYIDPPMRGKGIGRAMLAYLARLAQERQCGRLDWSVLDWNEPAINFYKKLGAVPQQEWTIYRVTGEALHRLAQEF
ncbi:MAG: GNAT family N-acetyltransferase [Anaerolineae bacterium]|nr:GNAT family N-acetyltransferase [Anaerolineae bacterium]